MHCKKTLAAAAVALSLTATGALAAPMNPAYDTFSNLAGATYGGSGIPTDPSAITVFSDDGSTITLGMIAHQRFSNPALTNDGAGTFFAGIGANNGTPGQAGTAATWNFGFYINIAGGGNNLSDWDFTLHYDFNPGADTDESLAGSVNLNLAAIAAGVGTTTLLQDSQNATFGFLCGTPPLGFVTPPTSCAFDPYEAGEYSFALVASQRGVELGRSAINVAVIPEPASLALLGLGLAGLGFSRRKG